MKPWINSNIVDTFKDIEQPKLEDDYYSYTNYDWLKNSKIGNGKSCNSTSKELSKVIDNRVMDIITNNDSNEHNTKIFSHYYNLLSDWKSRDKFAYKKELKKHLDTIEAISNLKELTDYLISEECSYHGRSIIQTNLSYDIKNSDYYCIVISPTQLSLVDSGEYSNITSLGERNKKYNKDLSYFIFKKFGYNEDRIKEINENRYKYESLISSSIFSREDRSKSDYLDKTYNRVTLDDLKEICKNFPIVEFLKSREVSHSKVLILSQPLWLKRVDELYTESNLHLIKDYILERSVCRYKNCMGEKIFRYVQKLWNEYSGSSGNENDKLIFTKTIKSEFSPIVSQIYIDKYIDKDTKDNITKLTKDIIKEYRTMLSHNTWLSKDTISKAIEKLDNIKLRIAYPDKFDNFDDFEDSIDNESLYDFQVRLNKYDRRKNVIEKINTKVDHDKWEEDICEVNAYNCLPENSIQILGGILDGFFYNKDMSYEEILGSIGMIIAHEISHTFDTNGSKFDKDGNMNNWWNDKDLEKFNNRVNKLIKYLDTMSFSEDDSNYKGILVYKEMSADILAMKCILQLASKITNFDYDKFFTKYSQMYRCIVTKETNDNLLKASNHPLSLLRVNLVLQQFDEFYKTYPTINEDSKMYLKPEDRISIW